MLSSLVFDFYSKPSTSDRKHMMPTRYRQIKEIFTKQNLFGEEVEVDNFFNIEIDKPVKISYWTEQYAVSSNNISNYFYNGKKNLLSKSSKISRVLSSKKKKAE